MPSLPAIESDLKSGLASSSSRWAATSSRTTFRGEDLLLAVRPDPSRARTSEPTCLAKPSTALTPPFVVPFRLAVAQRRLSSISA